jgi:hypothetical protein
MLVDFNTLPEDSRIWIYQSNRKLTDEEVQEIEQAVADFLQKWATHGKDLHASFVTKYNRFIIIAVDQAIQNVSGCSIDASVTFIQELEQKYQIDLLDKMNVTFKLGEHIAHKPLIEFKQMAKQKAVSENTIVFNNLVNTIGEWKDFWEVPAKDSWHSRFF